MRELKLRAYVKNYPLMNSDGLCDVISIDFKGGLVKLHHNGIMAQFEISDVKLMQYTGLKDRNDKEIYDGDIVKVTDANGEITKYNSDTGIGVVEWLEKWGFWNVSGIENALGDLIYNYEVEVIGNKWESPELLKEGKP